MPWEINTLEDEKIFMVRNWGEYTMKDAARQINELFRLANKFGFYNVLVDNAEMTTRLSIADLRYLPELYRALKIPMKARVAILFSPSKTSRSVDLYFYEKLASSQGYTTKLFTDAESAREWLKE